MSKKENQTTTFQFPQLNEFPKATLLIPVNGFQEVNEDFTHDLNSLAYYQWVAHIEKKAWVQFLKLHGLEDQWKRFFSWDNA